MRDPKSSSHMIMAIETTRSPTLRVFSPTLHSSPHKTPLDQGNSPHRSSGGWLPAASTRCTSVRGDLPYTRATSFVGVGEPR